jgi:RimJ/RimL family protein N-acetyltransferase
VTLAGSPPAVLRPAASPDDAELLRAWKNADRTAFFDQSEITVAQQAEWLSGLARRDDDFMFMVDVSGRPVGCMGYRRRGEAIDVYNVICGRREYRRGGIMSRALQAMLRSAEDAYHLPITARVLRSNPAAAFYAVNGFVVAEEEEDRVLMLWAPGPGPHGGHPEGPPDDERAR